MATAQIIFSQMCEWSDPQSRPRTVTPDGLAPQTFRWHERADGVRIVEDGTNPPPMRPVAIYLDHKSYALMMEDSPRWVTVKDTGPEFCDLPIYLVRAVHPHIHVCAERI